MLGDMINVSCCVKFPIVPSCIRFLLMLAGTVSIDFLRNFAPDLLSSWKCVCVCVWQCLVDCGVSWMWKLWRFNQIEPFHAQQDPSDMWCIAFSVQARLALASWSRDPFL